MATFNLTVVSAEQKIFSGLVNSVQATGIKGTWYFSRSYTIAYCDQTGNCEIYF